MTDLGRSTRRRPSSLLLLRIYLVAVVVPVLLRLRLSRVSVLVEPRWPRPEPEPDEERATEIIRGVDWVMKSGWPLVRPGCLTRGLTLLYFLRRAGVDVELLFGVGHVDGKTEGHCWLVRAGEPYLEASDPRLRFTGVCRLVPGAAVPVR